MTRFTSLIASILLGAAAVAIGMGFFLKKANDDRERLAEIAMLAETETKNAQQAQQTAIQDANSKLAAANAEISKAQLVIKALEEERLMMAQATNLAEPNSREIKGWNSALNVPLKVSVKFPKGSAIDSNDENSLTLATTSTVQTAETVDSRWFSLSTYSQRLEDELVSGMTTSSPVSFLASGKLVVGRLGKMSGRKGDIMVLHVQSKGEKTHLIWMRSPTTRDGDPTMTNVLATLDFAD